MTRKFFSLIQGGKITIAPKTKVLPAADFSSLLDSIEILKVAQEDAETFKIDQAEESEIVKTQAAKEGFEKGFAEWTDALARLEKEIKTVRGEMEKLIASVALKAAQKIVGREIELSETAVVDIVSTSLKAVSQHKKVTIYVNRKDLAVLDAHRNKLKSIFENLESLSIREKADVETGGCVIETEGGIINARLENLWRVLERAFEALFKTGSHEKQE